MKKNVFVVGVNGELGYNFLHNFHSSYNIYLGYDSLPKNTRLDAILNFAGWRKNSDSHPVYNEHESLINLKKLSILAEYHEGTLIHIGSAKESSKSNDAYTQAKRAERNFLQTLNQKLNFIIVNCQSFFGQKKKLGFIDYCVDQLVNEREIIVENPLEKRDFIHISDVARVVHLIIEKNPKNKYFDVGQGKLYQLSQFAITARNIYGKGKVTIKEKKKVDLTVKPADLKMVQEYLDFYPTIEPYEWLKNHFKNLNKKF